MPRSSPSVILFVATWMVAAFSAQAQRPHIGFAYPAGGQQGATFEMRIGGQGLDGVLDVRVSGEGVTADILEYHWPMSPQDATLLREQLTELRKNRQPTPAESNLIARIDYRLNNWVLFPACRSIASLLYVRVRINPNAPPGERELRVITPRGPSNPLVFYVGQLPEYTRKPMRTAPFQVLGKEYLALRNRPANEAEVRIAIPCTLNGQIASREVNSYRFTAHKGQRLVITTLARQLIPYIADGVPGWFQPVIALYDADGKEVAYSDDYRFKPDPTILYQVPKDGEYVLAIYDSIFRGREDFVYRITIGEQPFVTSIFPLGARTGETVDIKMNGWNLDGAEIVPPNPDAGEGVHLIVAQRNGQLSNPIPFARDTLPECLETEPNNKTAQAQPIALPIIINGRIDKPDDCDVFQFHGKAGETVVAEVYARRLDSPLDSAVKLTDSQGRLIAFNDDWEDLASGLNTHHADSYFMAKLPSDGVYYVHITDTARNGGDEYGYRLRISHPRPDFALRAVPSSAGIRDRNGATVSVYGIRKDGFIGPITIGLKSPPHGFTAPPVTLGTQAVTRLWFRTAFTNEIHLHPLQIEGRAKIGDTEIAREAVPAEDKMQAFLWRHLVPAKEFWVTVYPISFQLPPKRIPPELPPSSSPPLLTVSTTSSTGTNAVPAAPKFTKAQVAGRLRQLRRLYEDGYFTDSFYLAKVAECEAAQ